MASVGENLHISPSPSTNPHSQLNGVCEVNNSDSMENISSIQDNIFFQTFGKPLRKHTPSSPSSSKQEERNILSSNDNEDIEYRPDSGFVHRLLGKFSHLDSKSDTSGNAASFSSLSKKYASLEDIASDPEVFKRKSSREDPPTVNSQRQNLISSHRAKSIESLDVTTRNFQSLSNTTSYGRTRLDSDRPSKSPRDSHIIAPDVESARDDIIIIENTPPVPTLQLGGDDDNVEKEPQVVSYREEILPEELPKPNTVLNVRSIFETAATVSVASSLISRRHRSESSDQTSENTQSSRKESSSNRNSYSSTSSILSPRATSSQSDPFKFDSSNKYQQYTSNISDAGKSSPLSPSSKATPLPTSYSSSSKDSTPRDDAALSSTPSSARSDSSLSQSGLLSEQKSSSMLDRGSYFDRSTPSPRNTASVKPTIATKAPTASVNVKPIPLSTPASAATSYKKSSPVVPVAPFKKTEDTSDESPFLIYQKPRTPVKKPERQNKQRSQVNGKEQNTEKDVIILKDTRNNAESVETNNKLSTQRPGDDLNRTKINTEKDDNKFKDLGKSNFHTTSASSTTISVTKEKTVINLSGAGDNQDKAKSIFQEKKDSPLPSPRTKANDSVKSRPAPMPPKRESNEKNTDGENKKGSMIYISSSDSSETDTSTPPETPRTNPVPVKKPVEKPAAAEPPVKGIPSIIANRNTTNEPPVKGIPSIIANRLKQGNKSPRDLANSTADSSPSSEGVAVKLRKTGSDLNNAEERKNNVDSNPIELQLSAMRKKNENNRPKANAGATQIFDSSQLAQKRKEKKEAAAKAAAAAAASQGMVPPLDFSGLNDNRSTVNTRRKEIKPCNIVFVGENSPTSRSLLKKQRSGKQNITFRENVSDLYEYPSEDSALQAYLDEHPNEPAEAEDVIFLDNSGLGESSDDIDDDEDEGSVTTPRGSKQDEDESLKSNPAMSSTSTLQSYRGRFQEEFVFGAHRQEPEPAVIRPEPEQDPDSMMLRPAEEEAVDNWSKNDSSDLLF